MRITKRMVIERLGDINKSLQLSYKPMISYHVLEDGSYSLYYKNSPLIAGNIKEIYYYLLGIDFAKKTKI